MTATEQLIAELEQQEDRLQLTRFDNDDAWRLGVLTRDLAVERGHRVAIDIRRSGQVLFHTALPGTSAHNGVWIERKVRVVERFGAASYLVRTRFELGGRSFEPAQGLDPLLYAFSGGSFPIRIRDVGVVGSLTVSGLDQADDHALAVEAIERFLAA